MQRITTHLNIFRSWRILCSLLLLSGIWSSSYGQLIDLYNNSSQTNYSVSGSSVTINVRVQRTSSPFNLATGATYLGYYLVDDPSFDQWHYIGNDYVRSLSNSILYSNESITVDAFGKGLPPGEYKPGFMIDYRNDFSESNELNNKKYWPHGPKVVIPPSANITTDGSSSLTKFYEHLWVFTVKLKNNGTMPSGGFTVKCYVSTNENITEGDTEIASVYFNNMGGGAKTSKMVEFNPQSLGLSPGQYHIGYIIDFYDSVNEWNELDEDNKYTHAYKVTVAEAKADLVSTLHSLSSYHVKIGQTVSASAEVKNEGAAATTIHTKAGYYLSENTVLDPGDVYLDENDVDPLNPGQSTPESETFDIPGGVYGDYYLLYVADHTFEVYETNEFNNISWKQIKVSRTDIELNDPAANPTSVSAGGSIDVSCEAVNYGPIPTDPTKFSYYLSSDHIWDPADIELATETLPPLENLETIIMSETVVIPPGTSVGDHYIVFRADVDDIEDESAESNNTEAIKITVNAAVAAPDIDIENLSSEELGEEMVAGDEFVLKTKIKNGGTAPVATTTEVRYYLSSDDTHSGDDFFMGSSELGTLNPGQTQEIEKSLTVPDALGIGFVYLLVIADYQDEVNNESNESNNTASTKFKIVVGTSSDADLVVINTSVNPVMVDAGNSVNVSSQVKNIGAGNASATKLGYYLSNDPVWNAGDVELSTDAVDPLAPAAFDGESETLDIPAATPNGTHYILFKADMDESEVESNEGNNVTAVEIRVRNDSPIAQPDLTIFDVSANPIPVNAGSDIHVACKVKNSGIANAGLTKLGYFLSKDAILDPIDIEFPSDAVNALASGANSPENEALTIPASTPSGTYYIIFKADRGDTEIESDEGNNVAVEEIRVINPDVPAGPFEFTPTNMSALFYGQIQIDGVPAPEGTWVGAFDPNGNCAGANQVQIHDGKAYIALTIYGDDPTTPEDEGMNSAAEEQYYTIILENASVAQIAYPSNESSQKFEGWANMFGAPMPAYNDPNQVYNFLTGTAATDVIPLSTGWNLISLDVIPTDSTVNAVFSSLQPGNLEYVSAFIGGANRFYDAAGLPILNTLKYIERGYGYWVKVKQSDILVVSGEAIDPDYDVDLVPGWNLVGYMPQAPTPPAAHLDALIVINTLQFVTTFAGANLFFDPNAPAFMNTLTQMENGRGYWVRVSAAIDGADYRQGAGLSGTPNSMFMNGKTNLTNVGEFVEVRGEDGTVVGKMEILPGGHLMTTAVYGDDPFTEKVENLREGEQLSFHFQGETITSGVSFQGNQELHKLSLNFNTGLQVRTYPNPFKERVSIAFELSKKSLVSLVVYDLSGNIVGSTNPTEELSGKHTYKWEAGNQPAGIYLMKLIQDGNVMAMKKVILVK